MAQEHTITASTKVSDQAPGKLTEQGKRIYRERLQAVLEPEHIGRFVAIEPESGRYFLGDSSVEAMVAAQQAMLGSLFFIARVGYPAANKIGGRSLNNRLG